MIEKNFKTIPIKAPIKAIPVIDDVKRFITGDPEIENFILWDSAKLATAQKGQEDQAVAVRFTSMGTYFTEEMHAKVMERPNENGKMVSGGINYQLPTVSFDAYFSTYGVSEEQFYNNMNQCKDQLKQAWQLNTLITIKKHYPFTGNLVNYVITDAYILIDEKKHSILGFRVIMKKYVKYNTNYAQVSATDANKPTYASGSKL